jgi:hypothetical protein
VHALVDSHLLVELASSPKQQLTSSLKENPRLRAAADEMRKQGLKVGDAVSEAIKSMDESDFMKNVRSQAACTFHAHFYLAVQSVLCCF